MSEMTRVSKRRPCPICQKSDWCLLGRSLAICMRSQSDRPKTFADGSVGYMHRIDGGPQVPEPRKPEVVKPMPNLREMMQRWSGWTTHLDLEEFAISLGVSTSSLMMLSAAKRDKTTWAFPMVDPAGIIVGIRLRASNGSKFAVTGSHQGMFIPQCRSTTPQSIVFLPEGPTNTASVLSLGKHAIGRPSSNGAVLSVAEAVKRSGCKRAVIVCDTDPDRVREGGTHFNPGADGAELLASHLTIPNATLLLPCKDMRDFIRSGGDAATLDYLVNQCVWRRP